MKKSLKSILFVCILLIMSVTILSGLNLTGIMANNNNDGFIYGDVNGDGRFNSTDIILVRRYLLEIIKEFPSPNGFKAADVNGDGLINSTDYVLLRRHILEIIKVFPVENIEPTPVPTNSETPVPTNIETPLPSDTQPPTVPQNVKLLGRTNTTATLTWDPSTDNVGVVGYNVYFGASKLATTEDTRCILTDLLPDRSYLISIAAFDREGNESAQSEYVRVNTLAESPTPVGFIQVEAGYYHSVGLKENGTVWTWGLTYYKNHELEETLVPKQIPELTNVKAISVGWFHTLVLKDDGTVWSWSNDEERINGIGREEFVLTPMKVEGLKNIQLIACSPEASFVVDEKGDIWCWGKYYISPHQIITTPTHITTLSNIIKIDSGYNRTVALKDDGTVWTWGYGYLGIEDKYYNEIMEPARVIGLNNIIDISMYENNTLALDSQGSIWAWGSNAYGVFGDGTTESKYIPSKIPESTKFKSVYTGYSQSYALSKDGSVWAWGDNPSLGITSKSPKIISELSNIKYVSAGTREHSFAIKQGGSTWAWGANHRGHLGNGTHSRGDLGGNNIPYTTPVKVRDIDDTGLSYLLADNEVVEGFTEDMYNFPLLVPFGTLPKIDARTYHPDATIKITQATSFPGTATIEVTAPDGHTKKTYTINIYPPAYANLRLNYTYGISGTGASGNFSRTYTDMKAKAPGFELVFSRTYNSTDMRLGPMGRGWTFGFESCIENSEYENVKKVTLPDGSIMLFKWDGSKYIAENSRAELYKSSNGSTEIHLLITKDQYYYEFNEHGYLREMRDRHGNKVDIAVDSSGRVSQVTDQAGKVYKVVYEGGYIRRIEDVSGGRTVTYEYTSGRLRKVTDSEGISTYYRYSEYVFDFAVGSVFVLSEVQDHNEKTIEKIEYYLDGEHVGKVEKRTDSHGNTFRHEYYPQWGYNIIYDKNNEKTMKWYDERYSYSRAADAEGGLTVIDYYKEDGENKYNEEKTVKDRNGNTTTYERDSRGNITKIINPDGSEKKFRYNLSNDVIFEEDEEGNKTYYVYESNRLVHKIQTIDNSMEYKNEPVNNSLREKFAVTSYDYYSNQESTLLGYKARNLVKTITDPTGAKTEYTYYPDGNIKTVTNPETKLATTYEYNSSGLVTAEVSALKNRTEYIYDNNGNLLMEKVINPDNPSKSSITRMVYDNAGRLIQVIPPNLYNPEKDNIITRRYSDSSVGTRYKYNSKGQIESVTDPENNVTKYTYDIYGNVETEEKPNGGVYKYDYDAIGRKVKVSFKNSASISSYTVLEEYKYIPGKNPQKQTIRHLGNNEKAQTTDTYDYAQRQIKRDNPADIYNVESFTSTQYYGNGKIKEYIDQNGFTTYFNYDKYDVTLKMKYDEKWTPAERSGSNVQYNYTRIYYDYGGRIASEWTSDELVVKDGLPKNYIKKTIGYYNDGKIKYIEHNDGRRIDYSYDNDRNLNSERIRKDKDEEIKTEYENNHLGKPFEKREYVRIGDIAGNSFTDDGNRIIKTTYKYDLNGNIENVITEGVYPDSNSTHTKTYTYDKAGRSTGNIELVLDYDGILKEVQTHSVLNWEGNPTKTEVKVNGTITRTTSYNYNPRGFLTSVTSPVGTTLYDYDLGGRLIAEVSPENYRANLSISNMDRNIYTYDKLDRVVTKAFIGRQGSFNQSGTWSLSSSETTVVQMAYRYDKAGNVIKELDALGFSTASGSSDAQKINNGYGTEYSYNPMNKVIAVLDAESKEKYKLTLSTAPKRYKYDALGRKVEEIIRTEEANGKDYSLHTSSKKIEYDNAGNVKEVQVKRNDEAYIKIASATYDYLGNALTKTDGNNNTTTYTYNAFGKVRSVTTPSDRTISSNTINYQYDVMGNLRYKQDKKGAPDISNDANTYLTYDNHGRLLTSKTEDSKKIDSIVVSFKYDVFGNLRFETDANGYVTEYRYDNVDRLRYKEIEVTNINDEKTTHSTTFDYDKNGNKLYEMDHLGNKWEFVYDSLNRLREKKDPYGQSIQKLNYNINNAQTESFDALNKKTTYNYDKNNRLVSTIDAEKNEKSTTYDISGNVKTVFDGKNTTYYGYDYRGRLKSVSGIVDDKVITTSYEYDNNDNLIEQKNAKNHIKTYEYNCANKLIRIIDNGGRRGTEGNYTYDNTRVEYYTYNADGTLNDKVDRNGRRTSYKYDVLGRVEEETVGNISISYTYDDNGNMLTVTDSTGTTVRTYDELSRVTSKTVPNIGKMTYVYDIILEDGLFAETSKDPIGNMTTKVFDKAGRLKTVKDGDINSTASTEYTYYPDGRRKSVVYPSGLRGEYTYYDNGLLKTLTNKAPNGNIMDTYSYTYDAAGNQDSKTEIINGVEKGTTLYKYDGLNRLKTVTEPNLKKTTYTYDGGGNRETETIEHGNQTTVNTYAYNDQDRLNSVTTRLDGSITETTVFSYDNNGNQLTIRRNNVIISTNEYNEKNQLVKTTTNGITVVNTYNGEGLRVAKEVNDSLTRYMYEYNKVVLEVVTKPGQPDKVNRNLYGTNLLMRNVDDESYYYMYNGHADVTALINAKTGQVDATYYYDAFGNILESTGDVNNSITYKGYQYDKETGLYYLNARMYDPKIARFLQEDTYRGDPRDPLSLNLYTYVHNNPLTYYDPTGHWKNDIEDQFASMFWNKDDYNKMTKLGQDWNKYNKMYQDSTNTHDRIYYYNARNKAKGEANELRKRNNKPGIYDYSYENEIDGFYLSKKYRFEIDDSGNIVNYSGQTQNSKHTYASNLELQIKKPEQNMPINKTPESNNILNNNNMLNNNNILNNNTPSNNDISKSNNYSGVKKYLTNSLKQLAFGEFGGEGNLLGTIGQVGLGIVGADIHIDVLDITHNIYYWEWTWGHAGKTALNVVGVIPIVGALKYGKHVDKIDEVTDVITGARKGINRAGKASTSEVQQLLNRMPELTGSNREKLLSAIQDNNLNKIANELYRPGAKIGDGGTATVLIDEFYSGSSKHLQKATERLKELNTLVSKGNLDFNDLDIAEALITDLENAINLFK